MRDTAAAAAAAAAAADEKRFKRQESGSTQKWEGRKGIELTNVQKCHDVAELKKSQRIWASSRIYSM